MGRRSSHSRAYKIRKGDKKVQKAIRMMRYAGKTQKMVTKVHGLAPQPREFIPESSDRTEAPHFAALGEDDDSTSVKSIHDE